MKEYNDLVNKYSPKEDSLKNAIMVFFFGGIIGLLSQGLLDLYIYIFNISIKEASIIVILTLIVLSSTLTAFGIFDVCVNKLKCALIIPITGFAHSITSAAIDYKSEGFIFGIGANIFKLAGSVILYGIVSVYIFGLIRLILIGG